ncbi:MAG: nucleotidyltransferase domain-containing protein [Candidatus Freyarchaeota archaeon]|nr:nucleotidyltransferase domain-containing protein [Candidatus Jordarchaeia archaeon]MBS7267621.1 nucleotidyltransferase domain-containing protein [Candidatus Jordarchaeia archaeon]MBS7278828.1 nucleotidyltransferase domain-containing protein [Candidatus Jordarchaeia archaeon]
MVWVPAWLGNFYSKIYLYYGDRPFSVEEVGEELNITDRQKLRVILFRLHRAGYIERVARGVYRAMDPLMIVLNTVGNAWMRMVRQGEYVPLIRGFVCEVFKKYDGRVVSLVLFGSVARGEARENSDLDFLVVVRDLPENYSQRVKEFSEILEKLTQTKLSLWERSGIFANIEAVLLTPEEASINQPFYLDMLTGSIVVYDRKDFMKGILSKLRGKLEELGARKITTPRGDWYWQLKDKLERGEVLEI